MSGLPDDGTVNGIRWIELNLQQLLFVHHHVDAGLIQQQSRHIRSRNRELDIVEQEIVEAAGIETDFARSVEARIGRLQLELAVDINADFRPLDDYFDAVNGIRQQVLGRQRIGPDQGRYIRGVRATVRLTRMRWRAPRRFRIWRRACWTCAAESSLTTRRSVPG